MFKYKAYRKASSVLAAHPVKITSGKEAKKLIKADDSNATITFLTRVSGIGPVAAKKFADDGIKTLADLKKISNQLTHHQQIGVKYFSDFEERIPRTEIIKHEVLHPVVISMIL
ncbi:DNA polymerase beta-like isoform X3 [Hydractinia symbiolongicarpus]|nr:DNA polymerase beta-like isoform X3 [Hydractinia symbiolongicarpus]